MNAKQFKEILMGKFPNMCAPGVEYINKHALLESSFETLLTEDMNIERYVLYMSALEVPRDIIILHINPIMDSLIRWVNMFSVPTKLHPETIEQWNRVLPILEDEKLRYTTHLEECDTDLPEFFHCIGFVSEYAKCTGIGGVQFEPINKLLLSIVEGNPITDYNIVGETIGLILASNVKLVP